MKRLVGIAAVAIAVRASVSPVAEACGLAGAVVSAAEGVDAAEAWTSVAICVETAA